MSLIALFLSLAAYRAGKVALGEGERSSPSPALLPAGPGRCQGRRKAIFVPNLCVEFGVYERGGAALPRAALVLISSHWGAKPANQVREPHAGEFEGLAVHLVARGEVTCKQFLAYWRWR